jgi:EAL domain-containing protein (putative c-di-GMP-specific phosphodiesterase class I)/GGDEF domain-containing protein
MRADPVPPAETGVFASLRGDGVATAGGGTFVAVLEVVRFAQLRRSIGYLLANALMQAIAERLVESLERAEIGRIGRTTVEFAFAASCPAAAEQAMLAAVDAVQRPITLSGLTLEICANVGVVDAGGRGICDELVDAAASALSDARARRVRVAFATADADDTDTAQDLILIRHLLTAADRGELELLYQPKLHARANRITSAEALLRWNHPRFGRVPTDRFIALAEETGAIGRLTDWVLARAVADQARLVAAGHELSIYINLSGQLLQDAGFAARALATVAGSAGPIGFEITETAVIADPDAAMGHLRAFREAGIRIAIDDYGSGLSSLAYLKQLPAHELKIDKMFVSGLVDSHRDPLLVRSSIDLAHALEMEVTAEGVDNPMSLALLRVMGCDMLQGYLIAPPLPFDGLVAFLADDTHLETLGGGAQAASWTGGQPSVRRVEK